MFREEKKTRLSAYVLLLSEVEHIAEQLAHLKAEEALPPPKIGGYTGVSTGSKDRMEWAIIRRMEYEEQNIPRLQEAKAEMQRIEEAVDALRDPLERTVLRLRYLDCDAARLTKWHEVAAAIYGDNDEKDLRAVYRLHNRALDNIDLSESITAR